MKKFISNFLNNKITEILLVALIFINIICLACETDAAVYHQYAGFFRQVEVISVVIFTIEYILRLFTLAKAKELLKPLMIIDFLAIAPFYLPFSLDLRILRVFRLFRILRIFKLARYFDALQTIGAVVYKKRVELISIFGVLVFLIFISSFLMFYAESAAQPNKFHNILDTFWWAIVTFTTVGYGDVYPVTPAGKILSAVIVLVGIMLFALPTSILTAEFLNAFKNEDASNSKVEE